MKILTYKKWLKENEVWLNSEFVSKDGVTYCDCRSIEKRKYGGKIHKSAFDDMAWNEYKSYKRKMQDGTEGW